jgi:hypothetical protein
VLGACEAGASMRENIRQPAALAYQRSSASTPGSRSTDRCTRPGGSAGRSYFISSALLAAFTQATRPAPTPSAYGSTPSNSAGHAQGHSVEVELVTLDVLHHEARLVVVIRGQQSHAYRAERHQSCAFGLKRGQALRTHEPGTDPDVKMQPILDDLAFGNALKVQSRAGPEGSTQANHEP